jgi:GT2 family glycosyltransferase
MPDVLIITVNYKGADATAAFLASAAHLEQFQRAHIVVVENGSQDGSTEKLRPLAASSSQIELLESPANLGYFGGANWALQQYLARGSRPNWIIVCNNDIVFDDPRFLAKLLRRNPADAAVLAPAIIARLTGVDCNPFMRHRPSRFKLMRIRMWHSSYYFLWFQQLLSPYVRTVRHHLWARMSRPKEQRSVVYGAHGAMIIFSRSYFDAGGYLDDGHFLYGEEFSVAEICLKLGLRVIHDPELRVWHHAHRATGRRLSRTTFQQASEAVRYVSDKYFRPVSAASVKANR